MRSRRIAILATAGALSVAALPATTALAATAGHPAAPKTTHSAAVHRDLSRDGSKQDSSRETTRSDRGDSGSIDRNSGELGQSGDASAS